MSCKPGVASSIPGFSHSVGLDLKAVAPSSETLENQNHCQLSLRVLLDIKPQNHKLTRPVLDIAKEHGHKQYTEDVYLTTNDDLQDTPSDSRGL